MTGGLLLVILQFCERYRQRFYLDWKRERGFHWRAGVLQFAKWPYLIMAFIDVIFDRRFPYLITSKVPGTTRASLALWPHIFTLSMVGISWGIGLSIHETVPVEVQFCAGITMMTTFLLLVTEWYGVPRST
jgi:lipoprotein signal peptidase